MYIESIRLRVYQSLARAYAVTVQCAAASAPSKNSPGTYATCCKQHAATAAAKPPVKPAVVKPAVVKPAVLKSRFPKLLATGQSHQGQWKFIDYNTDTQKVPSVSKQLRVRFCTI